jgi:hypothetical protein
VEDIAYCLLGLFEVNMPLLYGEGGRAFTRLYDEIIKETDNYLLFAWGLREQIDPMKPVDQVHIPTQTAGVFASHPPDFIRSANVIPFPHKRDRLAYSMTNRGLHIELPLLEVNMPLRGTIPVALLDCHYENDFSGVIGIFLSETANGSVFERFSSHGGEKCLLQQIETANVRTIYIAKEISGTIGDPTWNYILHWESLQTQGYQILRYISKWRFNLKTMVFELRPDPSERSQ